MKKIFVLVISVMLVSMSACGSSGGSDSDSCSFDVSDFTNGANSSAATSVWNCTSSSSSYTFAFFDDGAGYSSALGAFTWDEVGCQEVDIAASDGTSQIRDIEGSIASGIATFTQTHPSGSQSTASCTLGDLSSSIIRDTNKSNESASYTNSPGKAITYLSVQTTQASSVLQLENGCQVAGLPEAVNLIEVKDDYRDNQNDLWLLVDSENNSIISAFYGDISFKIAGAECRLFDSVEIECESDDCSFTYQ